LSTQIIGFVVQLIDIYKFVLIVRILLSWIPHDRHHPLINWIYRITDPILEPFRHAIPPLGGVLDISPIILFFVIDYAAQPMIIWALNFLFSFFPAF
jgi:YggT family protein